MDQPPIAVDVHESEPYSWTMAHRAPHGRLVDDVVGYSGYVERSVLPLRRREVANDSVVVIISFGEPIDVQLSTELVADRVHLVRGRPPRRVRVHRASGTTSRYRGPTQAERIGQRIGQDRNDFDTEFGPTNVQLHRVAVATDLGDAGEALDVAKQIDATGLSAERQARLLVDVARAHAQRRHVGEATAALLDAERLAPEQVRAHHLAHDTITDLLAQSGRRPPTELLDLARRSGADQP